MAAKQDRSTVVFIEGKYALLFDANNWIVSELNKPVNGIERNPEDLTDSKSNSYHINIQQAIIAMSNRMLKDSLSKACKGKVLELNELVNICRDNDQWMRKAIKGRCV